MDSSHTGEAIPQLKASSGVDVIDVVAVNQANRRQLYKKREPIYPKLVSGKFRTLKWILLVLTLSIYYFLPWVRWPRGEGMPDQAVLVDFANARFYFFFIEIWPDEIYFVTGLLILAALILFLVTSLFGRVWCGYACPQTVWTDLYITAERLIEGDRSARIRLDKSPWTFDKIYKKVAKHFVWLVIAAATGGAWVFYFHDAPDLFVRIFQGDASLATYVFIGTLTFSTYSLAGLMREQMCTYLCPWPRIQAALIDEDALSVTYRSDRGEPRGAHKKGQTWDGRGDCVECRQCIAACPVGIDIREGDQLECINCALCIDACDDVMQKVGRPSGLIAYDTLANVSRRKGGGQEKYKFIRSRTIVYMVAIIGVSYLMLYALSVKAEMDINLRRDRNPTFVRLSDGSIRNGYSLRIENRASEVRQFYVEIEGAYQFDIKAVGWNGDEPINVTLPPGEDRTFKIFLTADADSTRGQGISPVVFRVLAVGVDEVKTIETTFLAN